MKELLRILFSPSWWYMNETYLEGWDIALNEAMDKQSKIKRLDMHNVEIDGLLIWVQNYPYSYGTNTSDMRPSRKTIKRLSDYISYNERSQK